MSDSFKRINANNNFMRRSPNVKVSRTFLQWIRNCNKKILLKPLRYYNYMTFYCVITITKAPLKLNNNYKNLCITNHLSNLWSVVFCYAWAECFGDENGKSSMAKDRFSAIETMGLRVKKVKPLEILVF